MKHLLFYRVSFRAIACCAKVFLSAVLICFDGALCAGVTRSRLVFVSADLCGSHHALHLSLVEVAHRILHSIIRIVKAVFEGILPCLSVYYYVISA